MISMKSEAIIYLERKRRRRHRRGQFGNREVHASDATRSESLDYIVAS